MDQRAWQFVTRDHYIKAAQEPRFQCIWSGRPEDLDYLIIIIWPFTTMKICPIAFKRIPKYDMSPEKIVSLLKFRPNVEIWPYLVTLI